jgi:hypothetical protein|tara:strand:- start:1696 stop:2325 length:630 start_codon:yes stop_codon:yes gene_type:complete
MNRFIYFFNNHEGMKSWKCAEYLQIYHDHFKKFYDTNVSVMELGIHHGGSLEMWKSCFGPKSKIYGIDKEEKCRALNGDCQIDILIGDITNSAFRDSIINEVDIFIDDGGHKVSQQIETMKWILPLLSPNGVYLCEDIKEKDIILKAAKEFNEIYSLSIYRNVIVMEKGRNIEKNVGYKIPKLGGCFTGKKYLPGLKTFEEYADENNNS